VDVGQPAIEVGEEGPAGAGLGSGQLTQMPVDLVAVEAGRVTVAECTDKKLAVGVGGGQVGDGLHLLLDQDAGHLGRRLHPLVHLGYDRPVGQVDAEVGEERQRYQAQHCAQGHQAQQREAGSRSAPCASRAHPAEAPGVTTTPPSIKLLTDSTLPAQLWVDPPTTTRWESSPCVPTTRLTRASSASSAWFAIMTSLRPSATFPATPIHSRGIRALKSPPLTWARKRSNTLASISSSRVSVVLDYLVEEG
jgi:hypothetical protein